MQALIDGDVFKWRWAAAGEYDLYGVSVEGEATVYEVRGKKKAKELAGETGTYELIDHIIDPIENVLHSVKIALEGIQKVCGCNNPRIFLGGQGNFREKIYPKYKESRKGRPRPHHQDAVVEYLTNKWGAEIVDGREADDEMAIHQSKTTVICSQDKDMLQVPGFHYDFVKGEKYRITRKQADFNLYRQVITGDSTDDIPGVRGLGPKKADGILAGAESSEELLQRSVKAWNGEIEKMLLCARLVYLLRDEHDDFVERPEVSDFLHGLKYECTGRM